MTPLLSLQRSRQAGLTLFESILTLVVLAAVGIGLSQMLSSSKEDLTLAAVATRMEEYRLASNRYVQDNFGAVETAATAGPYAVPLNTLVAGNYLPAGYSNNNEFRQAHQIYVRRRAPGVIETLVVTTGGRSMNQKEGGAVARLLKGQGGFVPVGSPNAIGTKGGWTAVLNNFVPGGLPRPSGHPAAYALIRKNNGPNGALMRDDTGNPADNRMSTNLDMDFNDILNVRNIGIGGQVINNTTVNNINGLASVNCANGEAITKVGSAFMCVPINGVPKGGIAAFRNSCPQGWSQLAGASGRVLVGAGGTYALGEQGGADWMTLTPNQMPTHAHYQFADAQQAYDTLRGPTRDSAPNRGASGSSSGASYNIGANTSGARATLGKSSDAGQGEAFDNRQAYYVVNYCEKI